MELGLSVERVAGDTRRGVASIDGDVGFGSLGTPVLESW